MVSLIPIYIVWLVFEASILHVLVFLQKTFCDLLKCWWLNLGEVGYVLPFLLPGGVCLCMCACVYVGGCGCECMIIGPQKGLQRYRVSV